MNMQRALAASISVAEKWTTKENVHWLPFFGKFRQRNHPHVSAPHHALFFQFLLMFSIFTRILSLEHLFYAYFTHEWSKHKRIRTVRQYLGSLAHPRGMYYNGKEGRKEPLLITSYNTGRACHISINSASRRSRHKSYALWLATCYNKRWLRTHTTQLSSDRFNFRIGQTFVELVWTTTYKRFSKS